MSFELPDVPDRTPNLIEGADRIQDITPSDTVDLPFITRAIWVSSSSGNVVVIMKDADVSDGSSGVVTIPSVPGSGFLLKVRARRVYATGTTAGALQAWG